MNNPEFPTLTLVILSFFAGFAAAIWLAVAIDRDAKQVEQVNEQTNKEPG